MMEIVFETGAPGAETIDRFGADELVASLLLLYGLHPLAFESRVLRALESVRPHLASHGGDVELLGTADGTVRLRLLGACRGRGSSAMALRQTIDEAVYTAAPDLVTIEVEGAEAEPPAPGLVRIGRPSRASA
jgi:Fe-S cluster biogenesis protein NfuA